VLRENIFPRHKLQLPLERLQGREQAPPAESRPKDGPLQGGEKGCEFERIKQEIEEMRVQETQQFELMFAEFESALAKTREARERDRLREGD
jgi:hypothetical protein